MTMDHRPQQPVTPKSLAAAEARSPSLNLEPPHSLKLEALAVPRDKNLPTEDSPMAKSVSQTATSDIPSGSEASAEESPKPGEEEEGEEGQRHSRRSLPRESLGNLLRGKVS